jgi:2-octaprenyl-6-methoxyphenol hydroxylase
MNVCIIGDGLTSLSLAKNLINKKINVHIYHHKKINSLTLNRTIGISRNNLEFIKKNILKISKKNFWEIKKIEIYSENLKNNKILNFENKKNELFFMMKNQEFYKLLNIDLLKSKFFKKIIIKKNNFYEKIIKEKNYDLIINCDPNNYLSKKYFSKKIDKDYNSLAYTTVLEHKKLENNTAIQVFTKSGPIAFLPISNKETSIVCSLDIKNKEYSENEVLDLIKKNNPKFKIKKISKLNNFKLKSSSLRNYHYKNILVFGDSLHRIHPLAGQGFNMTIRDIKTLSEIIQNKIDLGMQLDHSIFKEFEKKTQYMNFIFASGVDFIYEIFNFDKKIQSEKLSRFLKFFGKNKTLSNIFIKLADKGINI